ncbi:MAG: hypothetical protein QM601_13365 [Pseudoxanthomonas sp.]
MFQAGLAGVLLLAATLAPAADNTQAKKKLYCWNDAHGVRTCSDALPAEAVDKARDEFSASSGRRTGAVGQAMSADERAAAAAAAMQARFDALAAETRRRTDQAMLLSYPSEEQLRRVFDERTALMDNSVQTARYNVASLREGLVTLLQSAGNAELAGKPVNAKLAGDIQARHADLVRQQALQAGFEKQRAALDVEITDTLRRYRELKGSADPNAPVPGQG